MQQAENEDQIMIPELLTEQALLKKKCTKVNVLS